MTKQTEIFLIWVPVFSFVGFPLCYKMEIILDVDRFNLLTVSALH